MRAVVEVNCQSTVALAALPAEAQNTYRLVHAGGPFPYDKDGTVFGIIASTTEPFCRTCDRSRLTADGVWYLCLYASRGVDLRGPLRGGVSGKLCFQFPHVRLQARLSASGFGGQLFIKLSNGGVMDLAYCAERGVELPRTKVDRKSVV